MTLSAISDPAAPYVFIGAGMLQALAICALLVGRRT